mgnify:CR=1 FL=1
MVHRPKPDKPTLDRMKLRSREIVAAVLLTVLALVALVSSLASRGERMATAEPPAGELRKF